MNFSDANIVIAPAKRFQYWPVTALCFAAWLGFAHALAGDFVWRNNKLDWEVIGTVLAVLSPFPLMGLLMLLAPLERTGLIVAPHGLLWANDNSIGRSTTLVRWEDIRQITHSVPMRGPAVLKLQLATGRRQIKGNAIDGSMKDVLAAIKQQAPLGGYALNGFRLDITFHGGETWTLDKISTDNAS